MQKQDIINIIKESSEVKQKIIANDKLLDTIYQCSKAIVDVYKNNNKVLLCGNGGSAADAQHIAAELSGRFYYDRPPLYAEALHVNSSYVTAVANDYSYNDIYSRMLQAAAQNGDALIAFSTSGNSINIINALKVAKNKKMVIIGFTGENGGEMKNFADYLINIPSSSTPRIQEAHILVGHILCEFIEKGLFPRND